MSISKCELCGDDFRQENKHIDTCPLCTEKILADMDDGVEGKGIHCSTCKESNCSSCTSN